MPHPILTITPIEIIAVVPTALGAVAV